MINKKYIKGIKYEKTNHYEMDDIYCFQYEN